MPASFSAPVVNDLSTFNTRTSQPVQSKGPGGIAGFLVNNLPGIASGIGAVGGSFLAPGAGTVGGGAAGGALGEFLKRKILGQNEDIGQIATQGIEGGLLSGIGGVGRGIKTGAQALTKLGASEAEKVAANTAEKKAGSTFLKNLTTQGQQAQGRVTGVSAGSKIAGKELTPQDTEQMLNTLKTEGINTGNANNTLRDVTAKQKQYGQQIADHFKSNNAPLNPADTKTIGANFMSSLKTTDPRILSEAKILADDLEKNVKDTKSLWAFRKSLDKRIPDAKFTDEATSNKIAATKEMRQYLAKELGDVPGMQQYHDLSEIKPFVSAEAKRLNNPGGGIVGRILSSGPVQKLESVTGKATENLAKKAQGVPGEIPSTVQGTPKNALERVLTKKGIPVKYESDVLSGKGVSSSKNITLTDPKIAEIEQALNRLKQGGYSVDQRVGRTPGSELMPGVERGVTPDFTPIQQSPKLSSVELAGKKTSIPLQQEGSVERGIINTPDEYRDVQPVEAPKPSFLQKLVGAAANPIANPGQAAKAVLKQEAGRGFGIPAATTAGVSTGQSPDVQQASTTGLLDNGADASGNQAQATSPYDTANIQANVDAIRQQGGGEKDIAAYLANVKAYRDLQASGGGSTKPISATAADAIANAQAGLTSLDQIQQELQNNPSVQGKEAATQTFNPFGITGRLTGTSGYDTAITQAKDVIARLRTGAAISSSEEARFTRMLPQPADPPETVQQKIQLLRNALQTVVQRVGGNSQDLIQEAAANQ